MYSDYWGNGVKPMYYNWSKYLEGGGGGEGTPCTLISASAKSLHLVYLRGYMESIYRELALSGSKNEFARTATAFLPISEVCNWMVSLKEYFMDKFLKIHYQLEDKLSRWKVMPNKSALIDWTYRTCWNFGEEPQKVICLALHNRWAPPPTFLKAHSTWVDCIFTLVLPCETFAESSDQLHSAWGITAPFVLRDEMTESGGLVRFLTSRSQHVSWSRLESSEVTKGTIVPFNPFSFSAIERLPLPLSARMKNIFKKKTFNCLPK